MSLETISPAISPIEYGNPENQIDQMRKFFKLTLLITALIIILPTNALAAQSEKARFEMSLSGGDVIAAINGYRQQNGIAALTPNTILNSLAQGQSDYQASIKTVTHTGPGGTTPQERAAAAGYGGGNYFYLSEIIYGGYNQTVQNALSWWQNSSLHNSIMLNSKYTEVGAGVASNGEWTYFTAVLGGPTGDSSTGGESRDPGDTSSSENPQSTQPAQVIMPVQKATPQPDGSIIHTVLAGQTLWTIAAVYNIELQTLLDNNNLNQYSYVFPGDKIVIRPPGVYESLELTPTPTYSATNLQGSNTPTEISSQVIGLPYSSLKSTTTQSAPKSTVTDDTSTSEATTLPSNSGLFSGDPLARNLIIGAFIILVIVLLGSMFIQKSGERPPKDDLLE